ncbi:MAG: DnaB-like helicase C-terminal domain-containing protein [Sarcina sp.]
MENNNVMVESLVISALFNDLTLVDEFPITIENFENPKCQFFFELAKGLAAYKELTEYSVATFVGKSRELNKSYEKYGGWDSIEKCKSLGSPLDIDKYADDLFKQCLIKELEEKGFNITKKINIEGNEVRPKDLFTDFTCEQVYQFYELLLSDSSINTNSSDMVLEDLYYTDEQIEKKLSGEADTSYPFDITMTYKYGEEDKIFRPLKLFNDAIDGISHSQGVYFFSGSSGSGKSTLTFNACLGLIESGNKVLYVSNEMTSEYFKQMLICYVSAIVFKNYSITRKKISHMNLTDEEYVVFKKANEFIKEKYTGNLFFLSVADFNVEKITKMAKKLKLAHGVNVMVLETYKSEDNVEDTVNNMLMNSRSLDKFGKKNEMVVILPCQTRTADEGVISYLTSASIAGSKQIKEVAHTITIQRKIMKEELDEKNVKMFIQPYRWAMNEETGKYYKKFLKIKTEEDLAEESKVVRRRRTTSKDNVTPSNENDKDLINPNDKLILVFVDKCRSADDQEKILIMKMDAERGICSFIGYANHVYSGRLRGY